MSDLRNLFGIATTTAYIKALAKDTVKARLMCEAFAIGFGLSETDGDDAFMYYRTEGHPEAAGFAFLETPYSTYEQLVRDIFDNYYKTANASDFDKYMLTAAAHAMIFAYTLNSSINLYDFQKLIGEVLGNVSSKVLETSYFESIKDSENKSVVVTPFMSRNLLQPLLRHNYAETLQLVNSTAKNIETPITNYNWYDVTSILQGPNPQLMKDCESQYYYLSGRMVYESAYGTVEPCIEDEVTIPSWSGDVTYSYLRSVPCRDEKTYVGPVNYTTFNRVFNDGPSTSGRFKLGMLDFYTGKDKEQLVKNDYLTNGYTLTTYTGQSTLGLTYVDGAGNYNLLGGDYVNAPQDWGCDVPLQRMHIGDNLPRYICDKNTCVCTLQALTGFKFVGVELPNEAWTYDLQFRQTNPLSTNQRMLKRVWSVADNPYISTDEGGVLMPYMQEIEPPYTQYWYVGYPQLSSANAIPNLAFFQSFESLSYRDMPRLTLYPSIGTWAGGGGENSESQRTYDISSMQLFSGASSLPLKFNLAISSNLSGQDRIAQRFFGMGTAFSGKYNINVTAEENAGFFYSGFSVFENGVAINSATLAANFSNSIIGKYKTIKYISGYEYKDGTIVPLTNFLAKNSTGDTFTYQYVAQSDAPVGISIPQDNWVWFSQVPNALESQSNRIFSEQTVESYFPRYYDGPFSVENRKFLYPNAFQAGKGYQAKYYGIPTGVSFRVEVREEIIREVFGKYTIYADGSISETPEFIPVIRSDTMGGRITNPVMHYIFLPDGEDEQFDYNYLYWTQANEFSTYGAIGDLVDNNWAPKIGKHAPIGRNINLYNNDSLPVSYCFGYAGALRKRRQDALQSTVWYQDGGATKITGQQESSRSDGLFHAFTYNEMDCELAYVLPIFNLSLNILSGTEAMKTAFPMMELNTQLPVYEYRGGHSVIDTGKDPLFNQMLGGRRGGPTAEQEGGYHSKGLIGDRWMGSCYKTFGIGKGTCSNGEYTMHPPYRAPGFDDHLMIFNTSFSGTDIWTNGFDYSPHTINRVREPLPDNTKCYYEADGVSGEFAVDKSGQFFNFEIGTAFPLVSRTGSAYGEEWYYKSGLFIGPFDRDVEMCLVPGQTIGAYTDFYINGERLSHWFYYASNCEQIWSMGVGVDRILQAGGPNYAWNNRDENLTVLTVIPSGERANVNIFSAVDPDTSVVGPMHESRFKKGMPSGAIVSLRTHSPLDGDDYIYAWDSGEAARESVHNFTNNNVPKMFRVEHPKGIEGLAGTHEFIIHDSTGKLFPQPNTGEFSLYAHKDSDGNLVYDDTITAENYWRDWAIKNHQRVYFSGVREAVRLAITISNLQLAYDVPPYQSYKLVIPSGNCFLSGEMGYYAQADNSIFTEGVYLINTTANDVLAESYNPSFVSDVLKRVPSGLFKFPITIDDTTPVLQAPSVMKSRLDPSGINPTGEYYYYLKEPPYNYNKLLWPALSDLETLNPGETMETVAPGDGQTYSNSTMLFSASQGQALPNGLANPIIMKEYTVQDIFQMYDSVTTDSLVNSGVMLTSGRGTSVKLAQINLSGVLAPRGTSLSMVVQGLV